MSTFPMTPSRTTPPTLPQEIINLVVDEVADRKNDGLLQIESLVTLKACSLISKSFHSESRRHLFSSIEFLIDNSAQRRAARLAKVLEHKNSNNLLSAIRMVKFVIDVSSAEDNVPKHLVVRLVRKLGLSDNSVLRVLRLLNSAPLESFVIIAQGGYVDWSTNSEPTNMALRQICFLPTLKSLRIVNVMNIEQPLIVDAFSSCSLRDLALYNVNVNRVGGAASAPSHESETHSIGKLERLEISHVTYWSLLSTLQSSFSPSSSSLSQALNQSSLRTLVVTLPKGPTAQNTLWQFMLGAAQSLETLVLQDNAWPAPTLSPDGPIDLSCFSSLRTLKFSACALNSGIDLESRQTTLAHLIMPATSSIAIRSIEIEFYVKALPQSRSTDLNSWKTLPPGLEWSLLDTSLTRATFVGLHSVTVDVNLFYEDSSVHSLCSEIDEGPIDIHTILPRISASPSANVTANLKSVFSSEPLLMFKSLCYWH